MVTRLRVGRLGNCGSVLYRSKRFCVIQDVQIDSVANRALCQLASVVFSTEIKRLARIAKHFCTYNAEVENSWIYVSSPSYVFMACTGTPYYLVARQFASVSGMYRDTCAR